MIFSDDWKSLFVQMWKLLERLSSAKLVINLAKCETVQGHVSYLEQIIGQGKIFPRSEQNLRL